MESFRKDFWRCIYGNIIDGRKEETQDSYEPKCPNVRMLFLPSIKDKNQVKAIKK